MLVVELKFPAGRYHATAWGRHVNEGEAEWPPSPYRLIRALFDAWKRKRPEWEEARVERILERLASEPPVFRLPPATASHTRSYLHKNTEDSADRALVFDGFVAINRRDRLLIGWPGVTLSPEVTADLDELLTQVNYLGRSESWLEAGVCAGVTGVDWNCTAAPLGAGESVRVACAVARSEYQPLRHKAVPKVWLEALAFSTTDQMKAKISGPPALRYVDYRRPVDCLDGAHETSRTTSIVKPEAVLYGLDCKVLPLAVSTIEISEVVRTKLMGIHRRISGAEDRVSNRFSGKDREGSPLKGHQHMFVLPMDLNNDGRLDHILVTCRGGFDSGEVRALDSLSELWQDGGKPAIQLVPVRWGAAAELLHKVRRVESVTPFVPGRHHRKGRGDFREWLKLEVVKECGYHGLPQPVKVEFTERRSLPGGRGYRWLEFRRSRKNEAADIGYGFELEFPEEVMAPFAIGRGCHFGLGQFRGVNE